MRGSSWRALMASAADPYPIYHQLRSESPVLRGAPGQWLVTGHAEATRALRDPRTSVDPNKAERIFIAAAPAGGRPAPAAADPDAPAPTERVFGFMRQDPPDHTRLRNLVSKAFTARVVQELRPSIQATVDELLDEMEGRDELDLVDAFAEPLPASVISALLGVPREDRKLVAEWGPKLARSLSHPGRPDMGESTREAFREFREYFGAVVADRRREPKADLVTRLIEVEEEGHLSDREVLTTLLLLLVAGSDTSVNLISNGTLALARNPDQLERLAADPSLIDTAVEELVRFDSPVQIVLRFATDDLELGDKAIKRGSQLVIFLGAANRDPALFPDPDRLDVGREDNRHMAFGGGIHFCLGAALARLEGRVAFGSLVARYPRIELGDAEPEWRDSVVWRGLQRLPVRLGS
jgi:pimeloyl-[acyl-carrier protein] synthase